MTTEIMQLQMKVSNSDNQDKLELNKVLSVIQQLILGSSL